MNRMPEQRLLEEIAGPHRGQPVLVGGVPLTEARRALILLHGRGGAAVGMTPLADLAEHRYAILIPQAARNTWYPQRFTAPRQANEPFLSSALEVVEALQSHVVDAGIPQEKIFFSGFSQGACLTSEHVLSQNGRLGGAAVFIGGYIGPEGTTPPGGADLGGTPVLLAAGDPDFHVPWSRVEETAQGLRDRHAEVEVRRRPGMAHTIHAEDARTFADMLRDLD